MARRWIKLWVAESLTGTMRFDFSPEERGVWYDLLVLAGNCRLEGIIAAGEGRVYPHTWIAGILNIPLELLERTLKKCVESERIGENSTGICILNWAKYQSEYDRQKPYRQTKKEGKMIHKECPACKWSGITNEIYCPECLEKEKESLLQRDYTKGRYSDFVKR